MHATKASKNCWNFFDQKILTNHKSKCASFYLTKHLRSQCPDRKSLVAAHSNNIEDEMIFAIFADLTPPTVCLCFADLNCLIVRLQIVGMLR